MSSWEIKDEPQSSIALLEEDMYNAVLVSVVDLGIQKHEWQGETKYSPKMLFTWAIEGETVELDGEQKPRIVSKEYTVSLSERSNLTKDLLGWFGKKPESLDPSKLLGKSCRLLIGVTGTGKSNKVEAVKPAKTDVAVPAGITPLLYTPEDRKAGIIPSGIQPWIADKIRASKGFSEKQEMQTVSVGAGDDDDPWGGEEAPF